MLAQRFDPATGETATSAAGAGVVIGVVMGLHEGRPIVSWRGTLGPKVADAVWFEREPDWAACCGVRVALGFVDGDPARPLVLGFVDRPALVEPAPAQAERAEAEVPKTLRLESEQELILECGKAKISLRADGKVTILGGYVVSHSTGVNRIRGGAVQIN
jgi:hypothetical protein